MFTKNTKDYKSIYELSKAESAKKIILNGEVNTELCILDLILNSIPITVYAKELKDGTIVPIFNNIALKTMIEFIQGKIILEGKSFKDLINLHQGIIEDYKFLIVKVQLPYTDEDINLFISKLKEIK
jgi:hypothetical protein